MTIIFYHSLLFIFIIYLHGIIFLKDILKTKDYKNFYEISLIGLIVTIIVAQLINFIIPLNDNLLISNIILLIIYSILKNKEIKENFKIDFRIFVLLLSFVFINIYGSGFSDDIDHYHYGFIANADTSNFIWGQSFLHPLYGTSPSWLFGHAFLNFERARITMFFFILQCYFHFF